MLRDYIKKYSLLLLFATIILWPMIQHFCLNLSNLNSLYMNPIEMVWHIPSRTAGQMKSSREEDSSLTF